MKTFLIYFICILIFSPVAIPLSSIGRKSVDIVFIDLIALILFLFLILKSKIKISDSYVIKPILLFIIYSFFLGVIGSIYESSYINVLSSIKFIKPWFILIVFYLISKNYNYFTTLDFFSTISRSATLCILLLLFSQIFILQNILPRWGGNFVGLETYGFPNTTGQYLGVMVSLIIFGSIIDSRYKFFYLLTLLSATLISVMTLSRSGFLVTIISIFLFTFYKARKEFLILILLCFPVFGLTFLLFDDLVISYAEISGKVFNRFERLSSTDPLSGRGSIWSIAVDFVSEHPFFGAMFSPFSEISGHHQSAHNQYIESLYKTGFLGFLFMIIALLSIMYQLLRNSINNDLSRGLISFAALISFLAVNIGNLTQPNFTDSLVGGIVFALAGIGIGVNKRNAG